MASPIRPGFPHASPAPARPAADAARVAAQRAFFQAALGNAASTPASEPARPTAAPAVRPVQARPEIQAEPPADRIARPGSILDIKV